MISALNAKWVCFFFETVMLLLQALLLPYSLLLAFSPRWIHILKCSMTDIEAEDEYVISLNNKRIINFKLGAGT